MFHQMFPAVQSDPETCQTVGDYIQPPNVIQGQIPHLLYF